MAHQENSAVFVFFVVVFSGSWKKMLGMAPNGAGKVFFLANPDLANILGDMDLDFENFHFFSFFLDSKFLDFQVPRFPKSGPGRAWAGPGLSHLDPKMLIVYCKY